MKLRLVKRFDPISDDTFWQTEKFEDDGWRYVTGTCGLSEAEGRELYERVIQCGTKPITEVIDSTEL